MTVAVAAGLAALAAAGWAQPPLPGRAPCEDTIVSLRDAEGREDAIACGAVADALAFLATCGLEASAPSELRVVERLPIALCGMAAFGCYVQSERRIYMLSLPMCRSAVSDLPIDEAVYRGLVAHEVGHYVASMNFKLSKPTVVGHEYIAYVTMYATMAPEARDRLLRAFPGTGFDAEPEIGLTVYLVSPNRFGLHAYRHFVRPGNGCAFLRRILSGDALANEEAPN